MTFAKVKTYFRVYIIFSIFIILMLVSTYAVGVKTSLTSKHITCDNYNPCEFKGKKTY